MCEGANAPSLLGHHTWHCDATLEALLVTKSERGWFKVIPQGRLCMTRVPRVKKSEKRRLTADLLDMLNDFS